MSISLAEALQRHSAPRKRPCGVRAILDTLTDSDREQLVVALQGTELTARQIQRALADIGFVINDQVIRHHRNRRCTCD